MNLGNAPHQKSGKPERVVSGKGEAQADAARDEARPAFHKQEGLGRAGQLHQKSFNFNSLKAVLQEIEDLALHCPLYARKKCKSKSKSQAW